MQDSCAVLSWACSSQALNLFRRRTGSEQRYRIHLEKSVPHGELQAICMINICFRPL